jgi:mono/diheme cytochrome c family protein
MLGGVLLTLVWTAHQGGTLTHGNGYLTEYMPASLKRVLTPGMLRAAPASGSFYAEHIDPIFDANCVSCHGASKTEGGLRLDSYNRLMRGGDDGSVILSGQPEKSLLLARISLPAGDKHRMPAEGRPPLRPEEIAWIRAWIAQGASPSAATLAGISLPGVSKEGPLQPVGDYSALMPEIRAMQKGQGAKLIPVSANPSDGLVLNTVDAASSFGDAKLAQFAKFAPYVVEAELGRTAVTDASFDTLSRFTHLRALHLEGTAVTGAGLAKLAPLSQLTYLNLSETRVTAPALASLQSMRNLHHLYFFDTPAQPAPTAEATPAPEKSAQ